MPRSKVTRRTSEQLGREIRAGRDRTDWARIRKMTDRDVITDADAPEITQRMIEAATVVRPPKVPISLRLDPDVYQWLRSQGRGYQTRINNLLRAYMEAVKRAS